MGYRYSIGIGLNLFDAGSILLREDGKIITKTERKRNNTSSNEAISVLLDLFEDSISKAKKYKDKIIGVGVAVGGIVDSKRGIVHWPQKVDSSYSYISVPFKKYLENKFNFPVFLENDANASLWGEYIKNFNNYKNIIYMFSGVGCGILIDGSLYRGRDGAAGELFINPHKNMRSSMGDFSFLSQWPLDLGIVNRAKELIALGSDTSLIKKIAPVGGLSIKDIFSEAKNKDKLSYNVLREAAFSLGVKVSFLINLMNPEVVIIGGILHEGGDFFLEDIQRVVKKFSFSEMRKNIKITFSKLGKIATSLGAALLVFEENPLHK